MTRWRGRRGWVILGPTEARVAAYLDAATRHGWVTFRTVDLADRLRLGRSEAYRITARLRVLGLFGIANDQGGQAGGRRYWRTATVTDPAGLDPTRHAIAWGRIAGWAKARAARALARIRTVVRTTTPRTPPRPGAFRDAMLQAGLAPRLVRDWRLVPDG